MMTIVHSNVSLIPKPGFDGIEHACVAFTSEINVHVMGSYHGLEATVSFHVWSHDNGEARLSRLSLTAADIKRLVMERGTTG